MRIGGMVDFSTIDWAGNVSFIIFLAGCNYKCSYCHNSELIPLDSGHEVNIDDIEERLKNNITIIDSVIVSGGEPTIHPEALEEILKLAKKYELKTMIQTNGSQPHVIRKLLEENLLDYVALDFKTSPEKYYLVGGMAPLQTIQILQEHDSDYEVRTTLAPYIVTSKDLKIIESFIPVGHKWLLQKYRKP